MIAMSVRDEKSPITVKKTSLLKNGRLCFYIKEQSRKVGEDILKGNA